MNSNRMSFIETSKNEIYLELSLKNYIIKGINIFLMIGKYRFYKKKYFLQLPLNQYFPFFISFIFYIMEWYPL